MKVDAQALDPSTRRALEALGHTFQDQPDGWGDPQAVLRDETTGLFTTGSDPKKEGQGAGVD